VGSVGANTQMYAFTTTTQGVPHVEEVIVVLPIHSLAKFAHLTLGSQTKDIVFAVLQELAHVQPLPHSNNLELTINF
jgi:hypothetical protein